MADFGHASSDLVLSYWESLKKSKRLLCIVHTCQRGQIQSKKSLGGQSGNGILSHYFLLTLKHTFSNLLASFSQVIFFWLMKDRVQCFFLLHHPLKKSNLFLFVLPWNNLICQIHWAIYPSQMQFVHFTQVIAFWQPSLRICSVFAKERAYFLFMRGSFQHF